MASTTFVDNSTLIVADWLNDVNTATYNTVPAVQTSVTALATTVQDSTSVTLTSVSGTNTITASLTGLTSYGVGNTFRFVSAGANTGAVTININSLGAKAITKNGSTALTSGDITSGAVVQITYDGTQFQLVAMSAGFNGGTVGNAITAPQFISNSLGFKFAGGNIVDVKSAMPTTGSWTAGDLILNPTTDGDVSGWRRLTTGSGNVLGTDWLYFGQFGYGQTWQDVTASRAVGTTYTNTTGKPICINVILTITAGTAGGCIIGGAMRWQQFAQSANTVATAVLEVPPGITYSVIGATVVTNGWNELR